MLPIVFLSHHHRPEQTERHDEKERRHQIDERHGFDFGDAKARRHGQHAAAGGKIREHGRRQHAGQQPPCAEHAQQDDALRQRNGADGFSERRSKDERREAVEDCLGEQQRRVACDPLGQRAVPAEARAAEQRDRRDVELHVDAVSAEVHRLHQLMKKPAHVIGQSALYMKIYFLGMPFFMLYNYGAAILRAVGDTKRPLIFLVVSGVVNAILNMILVIIFHLDVAGVAIATVISQMISCILVIRCLCNSQTSYQLYFSKLRINKDYLKQIFQVGIPAGIQSTVINFSNALLQSSVNSFGSIAMAGYTAANNIFGFLYVAVNSVTQACMSFTSQNYGVRKFKRMDKVLIDCIIISMVTALTLGCSAYFFGPELLKIYTKDTDVIRCGMEILSYTTVPYFLCGIMDLFPGALRGMGHSAVPMILSVIGTVGTRIVWIFGIFPHHRSLAILFISYPVSWILTIIMQVICFYFVRRKVHRG